MRYILIGLMLLFIGCGSDNSDKKTEDKDVVKSSAPNPKDSTKKPPSIPQI